MKIRKNMGNVSSGRKAEYDIGMYNITSTNIIGTRYLKGVDRMFIVDNSA